MTEERIALIERVAKQEDGDLVREMLAFRLAAYDQMKTPTQARDREKLRSLRHTDFTRVDIVDEVLRLNKRPKWDGLVV